MKIAIVDSKILAYNQIYARKPTASLFEDLAVILERVGGITDVLLAYDNGKSSYRLDLWPGYKGNRTYSSASVDSEVYLNIIPELAKHLGVFNFHPKGVEADDIAGILSTKLKDHEVVLITSDQDWMQIVLEHENTNCFYIKGFELMDAYAVYLKSGCKTVEQFLVKKCIVGDSGDNILGVPKIGPIKFTKWSETAFELPDDQLKDAFIDLCHKAAGDGLHTHRSYVMEGVHSCHELLDFNMKLGRIMSDLSLLDVQQANDIKAGYAYWKAYRDKEPDWNRARIIFLANNDNLEGPFGDPLQLSEYAIEVYKSIYRRRVCTSKN